MKKEITKKDMFDMEFQLIVDCLLIIGAAKTDNEKIAKEFMKSRFKVVPSSFGGWSITLT